MKNRIMILAMAVVAAIGMISCGNPNPVAPDIEKQVLSLDNVDNYIEKIADYKGREVTVERETLDDETVDYYAAYTFANQAYSLEGWVAEEGDTVVMDYVGKMDGVAFEGGTADNQSLLLGSQAFIPGFEEGLIGVKAGDVLDIELSFPNPYPNKPEYAGKPCVFTVTVKQVVPGLSDKAVAALNNDSFSNVSQYKDYIRGMLTELDSQQYEQDIVQTVLNQVIDESVFKVLPAEILAGEYESLVMYYGQAAVQSGMTLENYLLSIGTNLLDEETAYAKEHIVFYKIAQDQGIEVTDDEVQELVDAYIEMYNDISSAEDVYSMIASEEYLRESILVTEVYEYLLSVTTVAAPTE